MSKNLVLLTGSTGFIGAWVLKFLLEKGYHVRAAVRSQSKASSLPKSDELELVTVPDIVAPGAYQEAIKNVTSVIHCASPFHFKVTSNEKDLLLPAREGTLNMLRAAAKEPSVKRVVITSSFAALNQLGQDPYANPPVVYDESVWNPVTWEEAVKGVPRMGYQASKKYAELAAFDFVEREKPQFSITTLCPPMVYGPFIHSPGSLDQLNESNSQLWKIISSGKDAEVPDAHTPLFVDVRDIAMAHVLALETPKAANQRYTVVGAQYSNQEVVDAIREKFPGRDFVPVGHPGVYKRGSICDSRKAREELGIKFRTIQESAVDLAQELFDLYDKEKK